MYLYDASAILNHVKRGELRVFLGGHTLDLAIYEVANAVWKECYLLGKIKIETAYKVIELISGIFNVLNLHSVKGFEKEVMDIAVKEGVTFYDASYMYIAMRNKLTLVTDDRKLMSVARKYVNVVTTSEIAT
ncbi:MAG: type II toxin-antitoxin system VapC family toxin [Candidatus Bathyarchaeia archaeon]